jgi:hypothetical protein
MKAILAVCVPICHVDLSSEKTAASPNLDRCGSSVSSGTGITKARLDLPEPEQATPPFWTWFIENPREISQPAI